MFDEDSKLILDAHKLNKDTFCSFPFLQVAIKDWMGGTPNLIAPCCNAIGVGPNPMQLDMESIHKDFSFQKVFHSEQFDQLRKDLLAGIKNTACTYCWKLEEEGSYSPRAISLDYLKDTVGFDQLDQVIETPVLRSIDMNFDNNCNLRCRMCSPNNSIKLKDDLAALLDAGLHLPINVRGYGPDRQAWLIDFESTMPREAFDDFKRISENLTGMRIAGGEPTISPFFWEWMEHLDQHDLKKNITLHLTTNGTKFNRKFFEAIKDFKKVELIVSIDGFGKPYDYLRHPFNWPKVRSNIEALIRLNLKNVVVGIVYIVNALTLSTIPELIEWVHSLGTVQLDANVYLRPDTNPLSARWLPKPLLAQYIKRVVEAIEGKPYFVRDKTLHAVDNLRHYLEEPENIQMQREFKRELVVFDRIRKQTYSDYLDPQLVQFLDSISIDEEYLKYQI